MEELIGYKPPMEIQSVGEAWELVVPSDKSMEYRKTEIQRTGGSTASSTAGV